MATIKSFTDISQSKKLAEILPIESADYFHAPDAGIVATEPYKLNKDDETVITAYKGAIPCWSLAALLSVLPNGYVIVKNYHSFYYVESRDHMKNTNIFDNPVDACVDMIIKLHEQKLL